jgi:hypothetical protein
MSHKGVILYRKPGETPPKELVEALLKEHQSCRGGAIFKDGIFDATASLGGAAVEDVMGSFELDEFKDAAIAYYFGNFPKDALEEDVQPFTILRGEDDKPLVMVCLEGNFKAHKAGDNHSDAFYAAQAYLVPKLGEMFSDLGEKQDKLYDKLAGSASFRTEMLKLGSQEGPQSLLFLLGNGEKLDFSRPQMQEFQWGAVSDTCGWKTEAEKPVEPPKKSLSEKFGALMGGGKKKETPPENTKKVEPVHIKTEDTKKPTTIANLNGSTSQSTEKPMLKGAPPAGYSRNEDKRAWYENNNADIDSKTGKGRIPQGYKHRPEVILKDQTVRLENLDQTHKPAETKPEAPKPEAKPEEKPEVAPVVPLVPAKDKELIDKQLKAGGELRNLIDLHSKAIRSPEELAQDETKHPDFAAQLGIKKGMAEVNNWPVEAYRWLAEHSPSAMAVLAFNLATRVQSVEAQLPKKKTETGEKKPSLLDKMRKAG